MSNYILQTSEDNYFDYVEPNAGQIYIRDIAKALSKQCRFNGHCSHFYSVAQHSIHVAELAPPELKVAALLHDAAEAYMGDIPTPLKKLLPEYKQMEIRVEKVIFECYGVPYEKIFDIKRFDLILLATEKRDLMPAAYGENWSMLNGIEPLDQRIRPWNADVAEKEFLNMWDEIWWHGATKTWHKDYNMVAVAPHLK